MNQQFLVSAVVIALGWVIRRFLVDERGAQVLVGLVFNVTLPALVVHTFDGVTLEPALGLLPVLAVGYGLFMAALGSLLLYRRRPRAERGQLSMLLPSFNVGLFAYPLVEAALGPGALRHLAMFDMGVAFTSFGLVLAVASHFAGAGGRLDLRGAIRGLFRSVPFVAYLVTLLVNLSGLAFPRLVLDVAAVLAPANRPLALLVLGMYLAFTTRAGQVRAMVGVLAARALAGLAVGVALFLLLPFDATYRTVVLACLLLPPPLITISYAAQLGYDTRFVGLLLNVANVVSFFLLWGLFNVLR